VLARYDDALSQELLVLGTLDYSCLNPNYGQNRQIANLLWLHRSTKFWKVAPFLFVSLPKEGLLISGMGKWNSHLGKIVHFLQSSCCSVKRSIDGTASSRQLNEYLDSNLLRNLS